MVAPTPISAYLHSAAMVKAGIYLVARFAPAFFLSGVVVFSGSLYAMALGAPRWFGAITPIGGVANVPYALAVRAGLPIDTLAELIAYARAHPGKLNYGSSGVGSTSNLAVEWIKSATGVNLVHVPYRVTAQAVLALLASEIDVAVSDLSQLAPHARKGTLRILGVAGARRAAAAPEIPTVAVQGLPGFAINAWYGIVAPASAPPAIVSKLADALRETLDSREVRQKFEDAGYETIADTPEEFGAFIRSDLERYAKVIRQAGLRPHP